MNKLALKVLAVFAAGFVTYPMALWADNVAAKAKIEFKGSSTLHDFEGTVTSEPFIAVFQTNAETGQIEASAKASLSVQKMTTNNKKRDKNMFKMFDLDHFKLIEGELPETPLSESQSTKATLHLKICNEQRDVIATISNVHRMEQQISCTMAFPVSLSAFNLKAPSVAGIIRVDDTVQVVCTITGNVADQTTGK